MMHIDLLREAQRCCPGSVLVLVHRASGPRLIPTTARGLAFCFCSRHADSQASNWLKTLLSMIPMSQ